MSVLRSLWYRGRREALCTRDTYKDHLEFQENLQEYVRYGSELTRAINNVQYV